MQDSRIKKLINEISHTEPREIVKILYRHGYPPPKNKQEVAEAGYIFFKDNPDIAEKEFLSIRQGNAVANTKNIKESSFVEEDEFCGCNATSKFIEEDEFCGDTPCSKCIFNRNRMRGNSYQSPNENNTLVFDSFLDEKVENSINEISSKKVVTIGMVILILILTLVVISKN